VPPAGDVSVLLLPALRSCALSTPVGARAKTVLAPIGAQQVLVVGGTLGANGPPAPTFVVRLDTGAIDAVGTDTDLLTPRASATVTAFDGGALVAGGVDPRPNGDGVLSTAEVYDASRESFDQQQRIDLSGPRARHGAVQLADGRTLLVGGVGSDGATPLASMEIVDPTKPSVDSIHVAQLSAPMSDPVVLRLASGEIFVAGVPAGSQVAKLEWFTADASAPSPGKHVEDLVAGSAQAFVALEGGGVLAVVAPPPGAPPGFQNAWLIDADGVLSPAAPIAATLTKPVLFGGAQGAPLLWTGALWLQWQPWAGAFGAPKVLDLVENVGDAACSPDPGLAMWLDATSGAVTALRFDPRGEYSTLSAPALLVSGTAEMTPDRLAGAGTDAFDTTVGGTGGLVLASGASAFVTDRTYADVAVDVNAPTGEPADVVLRDAQTGVELEVGSASCPAQLGGGAASSLHVERRGATVAWSVAGGASGTCPVLLGPAARVSIGLRGARMAERGVASDLRVTRLGSP
jgi:hypothetical protein